MPGDRFVSWPNGLSGGFHRPATSAGANSPSTSDAGRPQRVHSATEKSAKAREFLALGELEAAQALVEDALVENEGDADIHSLLATILDRRGEWEASLAHLRRANELMPGEAQGRLNLAMALLRLGEYREGLALYEARLDKPTWSGFATVESRSATRHRLLGPDEPVDGRRIVLLAEQGLGDAIMCARYIPILAQRGARIALASNPTLRPFFACIPGIETLLSPPSDQPIAQINLAALQFDAWLPLLSLPHWFGTERSSVPAAIPYWAADETRIAAWRRRFAADRDEARPKVGLVFQANPAGAGFFDKSMRLSDLAPLLSLDFIDVVNLQYGPAGRELAATAAGILDPLPPLLPLDEYAAAIAATDLLITVDTMAAHLAGAMGHPTWLAVPHSPHWVWGLVGAETAWYRTIRIFRQQRNRDWSGALAAIRTALNKTYRETSHSGPIEVASIPLDGPSPQPKQRAPSMQTNALIGEDTTKNVAAQFELALAQLRRGEFEQGFANYEARQYIPLWRDQALPLRESLATVSERQLRPGDPINERRIAVFTEQGLGDTFFGARFLGVLAERGAVITLICRAPMRPFFARLSFLDAILSPPENVPQAKIDLRRLAFDAFCPMLSLPHVLGVSQTKPESAYLQTDPLQVAAWRARYERLGRPGHRRVGLVWQANPSSRARQHRALPVDDLAPLLELDGIDVVNLQEGAAGRELARTAPLAIDATQMPLTLDEFAAALAATDVVVSVDAMAAHCAGALGHPEIVALPEIADWYWGHQRRDCPWYPNASLVRFRTGSDWSGTIKRVVMALNRKVTRPS